MEVDSVIEGRNKPKPNNFTLDCIVSSITYSIYNNDARTEIDSYTNMAVLGKHSFIFEISGKLCDVSGFPLSLGNESIPIVDAVIVYDCPYTFQSYVLMIQNALYVEDMSHNLIPPICAASS